MTSIDRGTSRNLFDQYLDKITDYYHSNLGFTVLINRGVVFTVYLLILAICFYWFVRFVWSDYRKELGGCFAYYCSNFWRNCCLADKLEKDSLFNAHTSPTVVYVQLCSWCAGCHDC